MDGQCRVAAGHTQLGAGRQIFQSPLHQQVRALLEPKAFKI
jgi:hypothetical protein